MKCPRIPRPLSKVINWEILAVERRLPTWQRCLQVTQEVPGMQFSQDTTQAADTAAFKAPIFKSPEETHWLIKLHLCSILPLVCQWYHIQHE